MPSRRLAILAATLMAAFAAQAARLDDVDAVPHLDARGKAGYREFLSAPLSRAFAIAPGGAWGWSAEAGSAGIAEQEALTNCQANTQQRCQLYARDREVVFEGATWVRSWGPYKTAAEAARATTGTRLGERFPNLAFADAQGRPVKLADLRGKVVVLHFWGSWCPPCQREMPDLARLAKSAGKARDIRFVLLQVREDFATARAWASRVDRGLPLYDSGMKRSNDASLNLADGSRIADRTIALAFPTTYIVDKHGIVVFANVGPVGCWDQLVPFLRDAAVRSGR